MVWLRRVLPFLGVLVLLGLIYDAWIFYARHERARDEKQAEANRVAAQEQKTVDAYGGLDLKIVSFYAAPGAITHGEHASLCYGVTGAKNVRMDPPVDAVWPALTRCVQVSPKKDTEYRLIAEDEGGHSVEQSVVVRVRP